MVCTPLLIEVKHSYRHCYIYVGICVHTYKHADGQKASPLTIQKIYTEEEGTVTMQNFILHIFI